MEIVREFAYLVINDLDVTVYLTDSRVNNLDVVIDNSHSVADA
jgi:hypothetical protein